MMLLRKASPPFRLTCLWISTGVPMEWDIAIVGAGMGGAAFGYVLSLAGYRVVFLEKGYADRQDVDDDDPDESDPEIRLAQTRWPDRLSALIDHRPVRFFPPLGCGSGGSTLLYAGTLERFSRSNFLPECQQRGAGGWPFDYDVLEPYYRRVEEMFGVTGTADPFHDGPAAALQAPARLGEPDRDVFNLLMRNGYRPYRIHNASCDPPRQGIVGRFGRVSPLGAKQVFIEPALATGNANLIDRCTVVRLEAGQERVQSLLCRRNDDVLTVKAKIFALAGGALSTPHLLLRSANNVWPDGLANSSGVVGCNLMFHVSDFVAVWPRGKGGQAQRSIALRDFYDGPGERFGILQSTGISVGPRHVAHFLKQRLDMGWWRLLRPIKPIFHALALIGAWLLGRATIFATVLEDYPSTDNRVKVLADEPDTVHFQYTIDTELRQRVMRFRALYRRAFRHRRTVLLTRDVNLNFGHACGTCRLGADRSLSVVDSEHRSHDLENLYIVDASCFASSGGVNPSLTIAAMSIRAGELLRDRLDEAKGLSTEGSIGRNPI